MNKIKNHFPLKKNYYIVAGIITLLLSVVYLIFGAWPFGSNTLAHYDLYHQIIPFLELIFDAFEGKSTLIYSNYISGGANIVGYFCYFIFNPFYLLLLPFGSGNLWYGINLVFILHIIAIALVFMWFIRKYFRLNTGYQIALSIAYAFSPYVLFNYTFFTWLMLPLLLPILVHCFIKLIKTGKMIGFVITSMAMIFNCYGIGLMGHIPLYVLFTIFTFTCVSKSKQKDIMVKMLLSYGLAVALSLFMLGPNALQLSESSRMNISFENLFTGKLFNNVIYGTTYLLINSLLLAFNIVFLIKFKKNSRFSQFLLVSLLLSVIPIFIDGITLILSLGSYFGYNMRLGYILTFVMFISTIYTIRNIQRQNSQTKEVKIEKYTQNIVLSVFVFYAVVAVLIVMIVFELISFILSHSSATYHSIGFVAIISVPLVIIGTILLIKYSKGKFSHKFFTRLIIAMFSFQIILNSIIFTGEGIYDVSDIEFLREQCVTLDGEDSRLKDVYNSIGTNLHTSTGFSSVSGSASQIHENAVKIGEIFGYYNHYNILNSDGGTVLSDAFLGYKYFYSAIEYNRPYLTYITKETIEGEEMYLYENTLSLNNAILIDKDSIFEYNDDLDYNTQSLYNYLGGDGNIIDSYRMKEFVANSLVSGGNIEIKDDVVQLIDTSVGKLGKITFNITPSPYNKIIYMEFGKETEFDFNVESQSVEPSVYVNMLYDMGYVKANEEYSYQISVDEDLNFEDITIYELNYDLVENLLLELQNQSVNFEYTKDGYNINIEAHNQKLVVTNANISGNVITRNGEEITPNDLPFIELDLADGENIIQSRYVYPYTRTFIICLILGILCLVAVILINKYLLSKPKFKNFLYYTSLVAFGMVLLVVYFVPSIIFIGRLCLLKF